MSVVRSDERSSIAFEPRRVRVIDARGDQRAAAAQALGVDLRVLVADAGLRESTDDAAGEPPAAAPAAVATSQPAATTGPTPGIANRPRPASETGGAADARTDTGARTGALGAVVDAVAITIDALRRAVVRVPAVRVVRDDADVLVRNTGRLQVAHRLAARS